MRDSKQDIIRFWFLETASEQWFSDDVQFDDEIAERFLLVYEMACEGLGDDWSQTAEGSLALCLLFDQMPRRMFRATQRMFATDQEALAIAKNAINLGLDKNLPPEQRFFIYLPFEHSERSCDQLRSLALFETLKDEMPKSYEKACEKASVIDLFGRFPERNNILQRQSTEQEVAYLKTINGR